MTSDVRIVDIRNIFPRERRIMLFRTFDRLREGEAFQLIYDHDPRPFYFQLAAERPSQFDWEYLTSGPDEWSVQITRQAATQRAAA